MCVCEVEVYSLQPGLRVCQKIKNFFLCKHKNIAILKTNISFIVTHLFLIHKIHLSASPFSTFFFFF